MFIFFIQIVPFSQSEIDLMVSTFRLLTDEVRRNIPDILLASMTILVSNYEIDILTVKICSTLNFSFLLSLVISKVKV